MNEDSFILFTIGTLCQCQTQPTFPNAACWIYTYVCSSGTALVIPRDYRLGFPEKSRENKPVAKRLSNTLALAEQSAMKEGLLQGHLSPNVV